MKVAGIYIIFPKKKKRESELIWTFKTPDMG
jgi:hypothetical protein